MTRDVVMFSGGLGSWLAAGRVAAERGTDDLVLLFADVASGRSPHVGEDEDTYRFIRQAAAEVLGPFRLYDGGLVTVRDGRDIWQVFRDDRFLGNTRLANCSKFLKQKPCREWLETHCDPADTTVYVGIDWTETDRLPAIEAAYAHPIDDPCARPAPCRPPKPCRDDRPCRKHRPCTEADACDTRLDQPWLVRAPMTEVPLLGREAMQQACLDAGIELPRLYRAGFPHNNCGGFCVRAGQAQMELLLREHPERYAFHEAEEQALREHLNKDVSVLRDRTGSTLTPLTLRGFRERIEGQPDLFDALDFGGCGCFTEEAS